MVEYELLDEAFYKVTERTRELTTAQTVQCCDWDECQIGSDIEQPAPGVSCGVGNCSFNQAYRQALGEMLVNHNSSTQFLSGCLLQGDLNYYAAYYMDLDDEWQGFVGAMGQSFVHQRVYREVALRSTVTANAGRAVSLIDQVAERALDNLLRSPLQNNDSGLTMDSWAASLEALDDIVETGADMALIVSQIGKTLPSYLRNDDFIDLYDETVINLNLIGRRNTEGVALPDADSRGLGGVILRAFIAEKVELEFPGDYEAFVREREEVGRRIQKRRQ